jgi:hypothetical protein
MFSLSVGMNRESGKDLWQVLAHSLILETQAVGLGWVSAPRWGLKIPTPGQNHDAGEFVPVEKKKPRTSKTGPRYQFATSSPQASNTAYDESRSPVPAIKADS